MTNSEKPTTKAEQKKYTQDTVKQKKPTVHNKIHENKKIKPETKEEIIKDIEKSGVSNTVAKEEEKLDEKATLNVDEKDTEKKEIKPETKVKEKPKIKKTRAIVNGYSIPVSTKKSMAICKFIKGKTIGKAIRDLEEVSKLKKAVPMKGEIPHRKGPMASGRFPQKTAKQFIVLLKSLAGNSSEMTNPIIVEAIPNRASRPLGRFGRIKRKRTHIKIIAKEKETTKSKAKIK